jgi:hypothetical protein
MPLMGEQTFQGSTLCALLDHLRFKEPRPMVATELNHTSLRIRRDLLINTREDVAKEVHAWATQNGFGSLTAITALEPYINPQPETVASKSPFERESDGIPDEFETAADPDTATNLGVRLDGLRRSYGGSDTVHRIIDEAAKGLRRNKREALLATIADLPVESYVMQFHAEHVLDALGKLLKRWSADPTVQRFRQEALERFLIAQLPNLVRYREASRKQLAAMARLVGESRAAHLAIVGTGNHLDELKSDGLYSLAGQVAGVMEVNEQTKFLDWSLRWLEEDLSDPAIINTASTSDVLASMLWSLFANPEKGIRWRAAHAARKLLISEPAEPALAAALMERTRSADGGTFSDPDCDFLSMSAKTWLMMTLARVAGDSPDVVVSLAPDFAATAQNRAQPHVAIREFARRAALRVACTLDPSTAADVLIANEPVACGATRGTHGAAWSHDEHGTERWHFSYDTERYWYGTLGERFSKSAGDIARRAEHWLIDVLGVQPTDKSRREDPRLNSLEYYEFDNSHGSQPRVESARLASEYHAMLLVAGELVDDRKAILVERYEPVIDPWAEWMTAHLDAAPDSWTIDHRNPTPPEPSLLNPKLDNGNWATLGNDEIDLALGRPNTERLVVDGHLSHYHAQAGYGSDRVESALVAPGTAASLTRAIKSAEHPAYLPLPTEDGEYEQATIDHGPFRLLGWTKETRNEREGLERHDPLARLARSVTLPGAGFLAHHRAKVSPSSRAIVNDVGEVLAWIQAWSDEPPPQRRDSRGTFTTGSQTFVNTRAVLSYLKATKTSLLIRVWSTRRRHHAYKSDQDNTHDQEIHRLVIVDQHGHVQGLPGCRTLR